MEALTHPGYSKASAGSPILTPRASFEPSTPPLSNFASSDNFGSSSHLNRGDYGFPPSQPATWTRPAKNRRKYCLIYLVGLGIVILIAVGVGVGVSVSRSKSNSSQAVSQSENKGASSNSIASTSSTSVQAITSSATTPGGASPDGSLQTIQRTALARWDYSTMKTHGVNLGNWLLLELWMDGGYAIKLVGADPKVIDEWTLMQAIERKGLNKTDIMINHYNTFITEDDIEMLYQSGVNKVRIPMGFWMWIPCEADEPYVCQNGQIEALERILPWLAARGIHVDLDLHGMPGSQAPDAHTTGHHVPHGQDAWFGNDHNLNRTMVMVDKVIAWIERSPYQDIIAGLEAVNEPRLGKSDATYVEDMAFLRKYYDLVYERILQSSWKGWMLFHHGYAKNFIEEWSSYTKAKASTGRLVIVDHPYPGNYPAKNELATHSLVQDYKSFTGGCPILANEYSLVTGVLDDKWSSEYYKMQAGAYSKFSGAILWSLKTFIHDVVVTAPIPQRVRVYSYQNMIAADIIPKSSLVNATGSGVADGASSAAQSGLQAYFVSLGPDKCAGAFTPLSSTSTAPLGAAATN